MDYHELSKQTVGKLREMAQGYDDIEGVTGKSKDELITILAGKLAIELPHKVVVGVDKSTLKAEIRRLKTERAQALADKDRDKLHEVRRKLHKLRHRLRRAIRITT